MADKQKPKEAKSKEANDFVKLKEQLNKSFKGIVQEVKPTSRISTTVPSLDYLFGNGLPLGRIVEFFGQEGCGKSLLATTMLAAAQGANVPCALIDMERSFDPIFAGQLGLKTDDDSFLYLTPGYGEEAFEAIYQAIQLYKLVVVDSVAALVPKAEMEASGVKWGYSKQPIIVSAGLRKLVGKLAEADATAIFVNQLRDAFEAWGKAESPGGRSLKFYASLRLRMSAMGGKGGSVEVDGVHVGHRLKIVVEKCKCSPHEKEILEIPVIHKQNPMYPIGVDRVYDLLHLAIQFGIVNMYTHKFGDIQIGPNRDVAVANLRQKPEWIKEIREAVYAKMKEPS